MIKLLKTTLTSGDMQKLVYATNNVLGTKDYMKYNMEYHCKINSNTYKFITWSYFKCVPLNTEFTIKKFKDNVYLHLHNNERYAITNVINELLNIWEEV